VPHKWHLPFVHKPCHEAENFNGPFGDGNQDGLLKNLHAVDDALLQYLSPLGWEHINLTGDYLWRGRAKIGASKFGPLRSLQSA